MNIYDPEGTDAIVDLHAAARELRAVGSLSGDAARKTALGEITAAALLDIALSLRVVAAEARAAMPSPDVDTDEPDEPEEAGDLLVVGDLVAVNGYDEPGEVRAFGQSEGTITVDVAFASGAEARVWLDAVTRLVGDERDDDTMQDASEIEDPTYASTEPDEIKPADLVDDIDADFDGAQHPAAATALDVLKANEAERKAAKKAGKKGSKK